MFTAISYKLSHVPLRLRNYVKLFEIGTYIAILYNIHNVRNNNMWVDVMGFCIKNTFFFS